MIQDYEINDPNLKDAIVGFFNSNQYSFLGKFLESEDYNMFGDLINKPNLKMPIDLDSSLYHISPENFLTPSLFPNIPENLVGYNLFAEACRQSDSGNRIYYMEIDEEIIVKGDDFVKINSLFEGNCISIDSASSIILPVLEICERANLYCANPSVRACGRLDGSGKFQMPPDVISIDIFDGDSVVFFIRT